MTIDAILIVVDGKVYRAKPPEEWPINSEVVYTKTGDLRTSITVNSINEALGFIGGGLSDTAKSAILAACFTEIKPTGFVVNDKVQRFAFRIQDLTGRE
jgi:hypothetical protein